MGYDTTPIECEGVKLIDGTIRYADKHTQYRLVGAHNKDYITRCSACQALYKRLNAQRKVKRPRETTPELQAALERCEQLAPYARGGDRITVTQFINDFNDHIK